MFQYFVKVVSTQFHYLNKTTIDTNQYSVTQYERDLTGKDTSGHVHTHQGGLPGNYLLLKIE